MRLCMLRDFEVKNNHGGRKRIQRYTEKTPHVINSSVRSSVFIEKWNMNLGSAGASCIRRLLRPC